jgi:hypothetical protein
MKKNTNSNKLIKTNIENILTIRKANTRNISTSIKKKFQNTKKKNFSMSSNEDIISKNKFKKNKINNELNSFKKNGNIQKNSQKIVNPTSLPHSIFIKFKKKFTTERNTPVKDKKNKKINIFKKNKFKKTIIIDGEGNNNLNIDNRFSINDEMPFLNVKKNNKFAIKPIVQLKNNRNSVRMRNRNYAIKSLIDHFKNNKYLDTVTSTFTETNSLFMNSNTNRKKTSNNEVIDKGDNKFRVNEYNKIIDILKRNITDFHKMLNEEKNHFEIKDISDYDTFAKNVEKLKNKNQMVNISISINNSNNIKENTNELISFLESSIKDEFYESLLMTKVKNKNPNEDWFNLSQSTSEFENISKGFEEEKCNFDKNIQLPNKNDIKIFRTNSLNKFLNENKNKKDKLGDFNIKGNINKARNDVCIFF